MSRLTLRPIVRTIFRRVYADLEAMEQVLAASSLDWTVLRPGYLTDHPATGYRLAIEANVPGAMRRADLARAMLDVLDDPTTQHRALGIASR
ncbi:NAD(P)-dependent oxidoreductase [Egibacter rhizosphaerae]|uniref:NAD(P)-dependent oxidoreductase n=1 Tax=Egibacter rhizosphaerae TaxID=1670831 RepID=UPI0013F15771|nr:NAD(P)-binding oxidoreductase [Egibacter rhizosphaerae]